MTNKNLRSPIVWIGGKGTLRKWVLAELAEYPHKIYAEPFGGGASVLLGKEPASVEIYNDLNGGLVNFFRVLADKRQFKQFLRIVSALPRSRKLFYDFRKEHEHEKNSVVRAAKWFFLARQSFAGKFAQSWGYSLHSTTRGMAASCSSWISVIAGLPEIHARMQRVQIESLPAIQIIEKYDTPETLFYLDPPYVLDTRVGGKAYEHEMTDADHEALVEKLLTIEGAACLSGYEHPVYEPLLKAGWTIKRREVACAAAGRTRASKLLGAGAVRKNGQMRVECLYCSPR